MSKPIEEYLARLKKALAGADRATIQDALSDAEEHLTTALEQALEKEPGVSSEEALARIIENYGEPDEVAAAYKEMETMTPNALLLDVPQAARPRRHGFFGVLGDIRAYAALLYMLFSLVTGIVYFTWAVTGLSLSVGLFALIIGIPFLTAFLVSARGIAVVEGRIVEAVLGERMPRRPVFLRREQGWWAAVKALFTDRTTWLAILYMILQLPLGIVYFTVVIVLIAASFGLIAEPILTWVFGFPFIQANGWTYYLPNWALPFIAVAGFFMLIVTLHAVRGLGRLHAKYAKALLVRAA